LTTLEDLAARVDRLEARNAITELVSSYAIACDEHDMPRLAGLFAEDAQFDSPSGVMQASGRQAIADMFVELFKIRGPGYHWTHDNFVRFDESDPDHATGLVLSHAETTPGGTVSLAAMKYDDIYRREAGVWLFAKRTIQFLYYVPADQYSNGLNSRHRLNFGDDAHPADYPENLASWRDFERVHMGQNITTGSNE
jgi:uncharacterized protein (TIGR02246 family)